MRLSSLSYILLNAIFLLLLIFPFTMLVAQAPAELPEQSATNTGEIKDKRLKKLYKLQDYYLNQTKKPYISAPQQDKFREKLITVESEIKSVRDERLEKAKDNLSQYDKEKFNFQFRDMDVDVSRIESPVIYANEISSIVLNAGVSLLGIKKYSAPVVISGEKVFSERISAGGFVGYFNEKFRFFTDYYKDNDYFSANKYNYQYNDYMAGIRGSYHFLSPGSFLNFKKFDLYATALAGMNLTSETRPFFDNEKYLPGGVYEDARKKGIVFGGFLGIRYMYDDLLGFYAEGGYANTAFATAGISIRLLKNTETGPGNNVIVFKVRIFSSSRALSATDPKFKGLSKVESYVDNIGYIYVVGNEASILGAEALRESMIKAGFKKATIIAFNNGELIKTKKAVRLQKKMEKEEEKIVFPGENR